MIEVKFKRVRDKARTPRYATEGAAGFDLYYCGSDRNIGPGGHLMFETGIAVEVPEGYELQIRPRSGLAARHAVSVINAPGTIDSDYRGEVAVCLVNHHPILPYVVKHGERIAQAVLSEVPKATLREVSRLSPTERGAGGFGSTGR